MIINKMKNESSADLRMNILVVEDEKADAILIKRALNKCPVANQVSVVVDGEQALHYIQGIGEYADRNQHPLPNLALLDLKLPKVSGLEVLRQLKNMKILKRIPVVILSSSNQQSDIKEAYDRGANSYFVKKIQFSQFLTMAEQITRYWLEYNQQPSLLD